MTMLPRIVLPAVATLGVLYPTSFLLGMWNSADKGDLDAPGEWLNGGEIASGWRYEVYERSFPKTYRMDMSAAEKGLGSMCILEVRDGPRPVTATSGGGSLVFVTLDKPLEATGSNRVMIDMSEVDRARCAGVITEGQLYAGGAASARFAQAKPQRAPLHALDGGDARLTMRQPEGYGDRRLQTSSNAVGM
jgi:hypothetical protein